MEYGDNSSFILSRFANSALIIGISSHEIQFLVKYRRDIRCYVNWKKAKNKNVVTVFIEMKKPGDAVKHLWAC